MVEENKVEKGMSGADQDVYAPIQESQKVAWPSMMMIFVGMWVSLYSVGVGFHIGQNLSTVPAIWSCIMGYGIAGIFAAFMGEIGRKKGLSSYVLAKGPMNTLGQIIIALLMFVIIGFGSVGLQADTVGRSIGEVYPALGGSWRPLVSGAICALMMFTAIKGVKYMAAISWVTMPFFFIISIVATFLAVKAYGGWNAVMAIQHNNMTFSQAVFLNAGAWAGFVMLMADVSRFLKARKITFTVIPLAFLIGAVPPICGVILGASTGVPLEALFPALGIGAIGLLSIIGIGWTTNDNNAYTAGLALTTFIYPWKKMPRTKVTIFVAVLGVIGAISGLGNLGFFAWIAAFHGSFNMSFVGVMIAHYLIVAKDHELQTKGIAGILAWAISGLLTFFHLVPIPVITTTLLSFVLYLGLYYGIEKRYFGETIVEKISPPCFKKVV